ncbi:MAG: 7-carboxy-7-deazaguanine synthase [bacterium]
MYHIKEIFKSLQGEGCHAGRVAVFVRFSGCNLNCDFCDTDFSDTSGENGGEYNISSLMEVVETLWQVGSKGRRIEGSKEQPSNPRIVEPPNRMTILTGGEPTLQIDQPLVEALKRAGFYIAIETNGTKPVLKDIDWITVSPKKGTKLVQNHGNELKLVFPQEDTDPNEYSELAFQHFYLQPQDSFSQKENTKICIDYCLNNPTWKLSVQLHKLLKIK